MNSTRKIAILIESHYDGNETAAFETFFPVKGYEIEYISNLRGAEEKVFVDNNNPSNTITVTKDISQVQLDDYAGLFLVGGYAMDMLRYEVEVEEGENGQSRDLPIASEFAKNALANTKIIVGSICHSLWIFTPVPECLKGRTVTCGHNVMYDVINAGAKLDYSGPHKKLAAVCIDGNLVTGRHPFVVQEFMDRYLEVLEGANS